VSKKKLDQLDSSFMHTQIIKESLLKIQFKEKHIKEFLDYCRKQFSDSDHELANVKEL
jgi:hypothetical protein